LIDYSEKGDALSFKVQVVPRASRSEIVGAHNASLRVRIAAPPVAGAANEELVRILSKAFGISKSSVEIIAGQTSKRKEVRIKGGSYHTLRQLLGE